MQPKTTLLRAYRNNAFPDAQVEVQDFTGKEAGQLLLKLGMKGTGMEA
jgi:hypothetical protein